MNLNISCFTGRNLGLKLREGNIRMNYLLLQKKKLKALFVLFFILTCLAGCGNLAIKRELVPASSSYVKEIGRTYFDNQVLYFALSGSGAEFEYTGKSCFITLVGDERASNASGVQPRFMILLNGEPVVTDILKKQKQTFEVFQGDKVQTGVIQVIKLSEALNSCLGIMSIEGDGAGQTKPVPDKNRKIEIIGDSISCGYGLDGTDQESFSTSTENVTKTYGYLLAKSLDADYSIVSYSGYGVYSGYTTDGSRQSEKLLPPYYDKIGFSNGSFGTGKRAVKPDTLTWDFNLFQPDLIILNLGTNDQSYTMGNQEREKKFQSSYGNFIQTVRNYNPNATILCVYGMMEDSLFPAVEKAFLAYVEKTSDQNVKLLRLPVHTEADGFTVNLHPTAETNEKIKEFLLPQIRDFMNW